MSRRALVALVIIAGTACMDHARPTDPDSGGPTASLSHALTDGSSFFFLLPPVVPDPSASFELPFNPFLLDPPDALKVEICQTLSVVGPDGEIDVEGCNPDVALVETFTGTTGPGSETIRVVPEDEHYIVNWHTSDYTLDADQIYRIRVLLQGIEMGSADVQIASTRQEMKNIDTDQFFPLTEDSRRTLPFTFRLEGLGVGCGFVTADCGEAIVVPGQPTVVSTAEKDAVWAFDGDEFSEPIVANITRLPDHDEDGVAFAPGKGHLATNDKQYLPQFEYTARKLTGEEIEQLENPSRAGVCSPADEESDFHPLLPATVVLAKGGEPGTFARLRPTDISDLVAAGHINCDDTVILGSGAQSNGPVYARLRSALTAVASLTERFLGPRVAHASAVVVRDAEGGSLSDLRGTPVGPVEAPDLTIDSIGHTPENPTTQADVFITARVQNVGSGTATPQFRVELRVDRTSSPAGQISADTFAVTSLDSGATFEATVQQMLDAGDYVATVTADIPDSGVVVEFNEGNNDSTHAFTVTGVPDLIIESLTHSPASPTLSDPVTYTAVVRNIGNGPAGTSQVGFLVGDEPEFQFVAIGALAPNATTSADFTLAPRSSGLYADTARADAANEVVESNETNNDFTGPVYAIEPLLYGVNGSDDGLSIVDVGSGQVTFVGPLSTATATFSTAGALAVRPSNNVLYAWSNSPVNGRLLTVDVCTGAGTPVDAVTPGQGNVGALAFTATDSLFGLLDELSFIDAATGQKFVTGGLGIGAVAFGADVNGGVLYGLEGAAGSERLFTVDRGTGAATVVATLNVGGTATDVGTVGSIVFGPGGGLIGSAFSSPLATPTGGSILFDIDPVTGGVSNVRTLTGGFAPQGMGFAPACPPIE